MRLADFFQTDTAVSPLHIGCIAPQMGSTDIFQAVRPGAAMSTLDSGVAGQALYDLILPFKFQGTHMHFVGFSITAHDSSLIIRETPGFDDIGSIIVNFAGATN